MPVHKFIRKPQPSRPRSLPRTILWHPAEEVAHPARRVNSNLWEVFIQQDINIPSQGLKTFTLQFGIKLTLGVVLVSLSQQLKNLKCSIQNETIAENTDDIVITIQNNSSEEVPIKAGESLCYLIYITP